jgi:phenylalanyl-tRNA synthetase alpha chain
MMPATVRDLSLVVSEQEDIDTLGDKIRQQYNNYAVIESLAVVNETPYRELPESARLRLGLEPDQKNLLLRLVIRAMDRTLTSQEANDVRNGVYRLLHQGKTMEIAEHQ